MEFKGQGDTVYQSVSIASAREVTVKKPGVVITNAIVDGVKIDTKSTQLDRKPGYYATENVREFLEDTKTFTVEVIYCNTMNAAIKIADDIISAIPPKKRRKTLGEAKNEANIEE
jgi:hypothetical protein